MVLILLVAGLVLAGCGAYDVLNDLSQDLRDEGFGNVAVTVEPGTDATALVVVADSPSGEDAESGQDLVAEVAWTRFPRRFERLRVVVDGQRRVYSREDLEESLGPRPEGLDDHGDLTDEWNRVALTTLLGVLAAGVIGLVMVTVLVLVLVRRNRRQRALRPAWPPPMPAGAPPPHPRPGDPPRPWAPTTGPAGPAEPGETTPADTGRPPVELGKGSPTGAGEGTPHSPTPGAGAPRVPVGAGWRAAEPPRPWPADPPGETRRLGRRPRGPRPPDSQLPPGWG